MIVRGICCLIPGLKNLSENIEVISIIDRFLEHSRVYIFENSGDNSVYISSADFMTRNIENRVEVATPIYDKLLKKQINDVFEIAWNDNVKARLVNREILAEIGARSVDEIIGRADLLGQVSRGSDHLDDLDLNPLLITVVGLSLPFFYHRGSDTSWGKCF